MTNRGRSPTERQIHTAIVDYLSMVCGGDMWFTTFPLGGGGMVRGASLRRMGAKIGTPDILVIKRGAAYWLEVKKEGGRVSKAQKECHADLINAGAHVAVVRSVDDVKDTLEEWGL